MIKKKKITWKLMPSSQISAMLTSPRQQWLQRRSTAWSRGDARPKIPDNHSADTPAPVYRWITDHLTTLITMTTLFTLAGSIYRWVMDSAHQHRVQNVSGISRRRLLPEITGRRAISTTPSGSAGGRRFYCAALNRLRGPLYFPVDDPAGIWMF